MNKIKVKNKESKRQRILERDGPLCHICSMPFTEARPPTFDHILEARNGGKSTLSNLKLAHQSCNDKRSNNPELLTNVIRQSVRLTWGIVPMQFKGDPRGIQPVRIVDFELAPSIIRDNELQGWYYARYA